MNSMTAVGRSRGTVGGKELTVLLRSVNARHLDIGVKLPPRLSFLADGIRPLLEAGGITRGRVEVTVTAEEEEGEPSPLSLDLPAAKSYLAALYELRDTFGLPDDITVMKVAENRSLFKTAETAPDEEAVKAQWNTLFSAAVADFLKGRQAEGERLFADMKGKLLQIETEVSAIEKMTEEHIKDCRRRLTERVKEALASCGAEPDEGRILTECALFADRVAVDEETVRLRSHLKTFLEIGGGAEPAGKKLDFLLQEMNREANTVGSKCSHAGIAVAVVNVKCLIEKLREQVQNIE